MPVPSKRRASSQHRRRAAHFALRPAKSSACSHCGQATLPHHACAFCGYYRGRLVLKTVAKRADRKLAKKEQHKKEEK